MFFPSRYDSLNDSFLILFPQIGAHGKTEALGGNLFGHWEVALLIIQMAEDGLKVQRYGVVSNRGDARFLESRLESISLRGEDGVYGVYGGGTFRDMRKLDALRPSLSQHFVIARPDGLTLGDFLRKYFRDSQ